MKIELQGPYSVFYKYGTISKNNDNRNMISFSCAIIKNDNVPGSTSYARYLMSIKLGHMVPDHLQVDHKDDDKTNDDINNLQLLTPEQNRLKEYNRYIENENISYGYECAHCGINFILSNREVTTRLFQKTERAFCSRSCAATFNHNAGLLIMGSNKINEIDIEKIKQLRKEGKTSYEISRITGFARNTVMKYWT